MDDDGLDAGPGCTFSSGDLRWRFTPSGGPGGQHANRSSTAVELTIDLAGAPGVDAAVRARLIERVGPVLRVYVDETRSQHRNRQIAMERAEKTLRAARQRPKTRRSTRPTRASSRRRVDAKRRRSQTKQQRRRPGLDD